METTAIITPYFISVHRSRKAYKATERSEFSGDSTLKGLTRLGMLNAHPGQDVLSLQFIQEERRDCTINNG
jgi:hypothetical protein